MKLAIAILVAASATATAEPRAKSLWYMHSLSLDGKRAMMQDLSMHGGAALHYRIIDVDTKTIVSDVSLDALSKLPIETMNDGGTEKAGSTPNLKDPALGTDLAKLHTIVDGFPLGAGGRFAVSKDGATVAINVGDRIATATVAKGVATIGPMIARDASYGPWMTPDGQSLMWRMWNGKVAGSILGKYELFAMPIGGGKPARIDGTAGVFEEFVLAKGGTTARFVVTSEPGIQTCVVDVTLTKPYTATKKACLADHERVVTCRLSPTGTWLACTTVKDGKDGKLTSSQFRFRTLEVDTNKVAIDAPRTLSPAAISDEGIALVDRYKKVIVIDSKAKTWSDTQQPMPLSSFPVFRTPTQLVVERDGEPVIVDLAKWKLVPHVADPQE